MSENAGSPDGWKDTVENYQAAATALGLALQRVQADCAKWRELCERVDSHYSGSLDHQPGYVRTIRSALDEEQNDA